MFGWFRRDRTRHTDKPSTPRRPWYVHYQELGSTEEHVSPPMTEDDAQAELDTLRQFQLIYPPTERQFETRNGPVTITSFTGCRAWIDTSK